ncbi:MAG: DNA-binding protein [Halobacteriales archaeon]
MSNSAGDDELERLREERLEQLRTQEEGEQEAHEAQREAAEQQRKAILQQYLTDGARKRLNSVKMSRPEHGERVEQQLVALIQSGRVSSQIDESQMKQLLSELGPDRKKFDIRRR